MMESFSFQPDSLPSAENPPPNKNSPGTFDADLYGDAVVPKRYFELQWGRAEGFELLEFVADQSVCGPSSSDHSEGGVRTDLAIR